MPNGVRSVRINVSTVNNNSQQRPPVRRPPRPPTPPAQRRQSRNLQVHRDTNILSNLSPFRRTKSTRPINKTKIIEDKHARGRKRKTKVNVAKRSKRASQKKRGRRASRRQRGGSWCPEPNKECDCPRARTKKGICNNAHQCIGISTEGNRTTC